MRTISCPQCGEEFPTKAAMQKHLLRSALRHGRLYATCRCCGRTDRTVERRPRNAAEAVQRSLCGPCWEDPNPRYEDCLHGLPNPRA